MTYTIFFLLGAALYAALPWTGEANNLALFVAVCCIILSMYGGGFAAIPAYLADLFGPQHISAIHGRLLTAWSAAGILGPLAVNYLRDWQLAQGVAPSQVYNFTMYLLAGMLLVGLACNLLIRPVSTRHFEKMETPMSDRPNETTAMTAEAPRLPAVQTTSGSGWIVALAWTAVAVPLLWGVWITLREASAFF